MCEEDPGSDNQKKKECLKKNLVQVMIDHSSQIVINTTDFNISGNRLTLKSISGKVIDLVNNTEHDLKKDLQKDGNRPSLYKTLVEYPTKVYLPTRINLLDYTIDETSHSKLTNELLKKIRDRIFEGLYSYYKNANSHVKSLIQRFSTTYGITMDLTRPERNQSRSERSNRNGSSRNGNSSNGSANANGNFNNNGAYNGKAPPRNLPNLNGNNAPHPSNSLNRLNKNTRDRLERIKTLMERYPNGTNKRTQLNKMYANIMEKVTSNSSTNSSNNLALND